MTSLPDDAGRRRALRGLRIYFAHRRWPRLMMSSIVLLSGGAGLLSSFWMLRAGLSAMWVRYPLAVVFAWAAFLVLTCPLGSHLNIQQLTPWRQSGATAPSSSAPSG